MEPFLDRLTEDLARGIHGTGITTRSFCYSGGQLGTALRAAAAHKHHKIVTLLLAQGAEANTIQDDFGIALLSATLASSRSTVKTLLEHGAIASRNCRRNWYGNPLDTTLVLGHDEDVDILAKNGAKLRTSPGYAKI